MQTQSPIDRALPHGAVAEEINGNHRSCRLALTGVGGGGSLIYVTSFLNRHCPPMVRNIKGIMSLSRIWICMQPEWNEKEIIQIIEINKIRVDHFFIQGRLEVETRPANLQIMLKFQFSGRTAYKVSV